LCSPISPSRLPRSAHRNAAPSAAYQFLAGVSCVSEPGGGNVVIDDCSHSELNWLDAGDLLTIGRIHDDTRYRRHEEEI